MPTTTIQSGDTYTIVSESDAKAIQEMNHNSPGLPVGIEFNADGGSVRLTSDPQFANSGTLYPDGTRGVIHPNGSRVIAYAETGPVDVSHNRGNFQVENFGNSDPTDVSISSDAAREIGKARIEDSGGTLLTPLSQSDLPLDVSGATVSVQESTPLDVSAATVTVSDSGSSTATAAAAGTGSANAAEINVPNGRSSVEVMYDTSGAAVVTVETSTDGVTWYSRTSFSPSSATNSATSITTGADYVRAHIDANLNSLEISAKGD